VTATPQAPSLTFLARLEVEVGDPVDLGVVAGEHRRIVPILGGTARGPELEAHVLPGGIDSQVLHADGRQVLRATYGLETTDGDRLFVENRGLRSGTPANLDRLARGEMVDPSLIYFRSHPRITAPAGRWEWMNTRLLVGTGERLPAAVRLNVFVID
jgi:hypothetical protein